MDGVIETPRLRLRPAVTRDVEAIAIAAEATSTGRISALVASQAHWWSEHGYGLWVALPRSDDSLVGWFGLRPGSDATQPELIFGLAPMARGRGLATEAAKAVISFAMALPCVSTVWAATAVDNVASVAVMKRLGMVLESREPLDGVESFIYRSPRNGI